MLNHSSIIKAVFINRCGLERLMGIVLTSKSANVVFFFKFLYFYR
jgi:hypothetical protein